MGKLYDGAQQIQKIIERRGLDNFKVKGQISMRTGFLLAFIGPEDPDEMDRIEALKKAAEEVLGERLDI